VTTSITSTYTPNLFAFTQASANTYNYAAAISILLAVTTATLSFVFLRFVNRRPGMSTQARKGAVRIPRGESILARGVHVRGGRVLPAAPLVAARVLDQVRGDLTTTPGLWFSDIALLDNVENLFTRNDGIFWRWLLNSLLYAGVGAAIGTLLAAMAGYALAKYEFRGRELLFGVILAGVLVPATALALPLFLLLSQVELTNTYWAVFLPSLVSPFGVYLSRIYAAGPCPTSSSRPGGSTAPGTCGSSSP
jgi:ABC-type maltose transport system permease subunit